MFRWAGREGVVPFVHCLRSTLCWPIRLSQRAVRRPGFGTALLRCFRAALHPAEGDSHKHPSEDKAAGSDDERVAYTIGVPRHADRVPEMPGLHAGTEVQHADNGENTAQSSA